MTTALRPGVNVGISDVAPARSIPTDTGTWFVAGVTEKGKVTPVQIRSMQDYVAAYGNRVTYSGLYDALDAFFHEGGRIAVVSRVVGPSATFGTVNIYDQSGSAGGDVALTATGVGPGDSSTITVAVIAPVVSGFQIQVSVSAVVVETSGDLASPAAAVEWSQNSNYIRLALGVSNENPRVQSAGALAGGTDDRANITITEKTAAVAKFTRDWGPGQLSYPGDTASATQTMLEQAASDNFRVALIDFVDTPTVATLVTAAGNARSRWAGGFAPWAIVPGYVAQTTRTVPYSAIQAGLIARNDVQFDANVPAAGEKGQSIYALRLSQNQWSDAERKTLNDAGVNVARIVQGGVRTYGYRSLVQATSDPTWVGLGGARLMMEIAYEGMAILESFLFDEIDGEGRLFGRVRGQLTSMVNQFFIAGSLFGDSPGEAYSVVCDSSNNTPTTIADRQLNAAIALRISEMAEMITLNLTRVPVNQQLV